MKRPHRSIETFDISLMAVVTKAMGAFLVLMLLLMPYYTSEPMGQKEADALEKKVEEVNKNIQSAMDKLATAGAEDLRKQLEEALRQLAEARNLITDLKRMIDQLNAQVARLENENAALKSQVTELQKEVADLKAQVAALQKEVAGLKAQVEQLQKENAELKAQVAQLRQENENLKALVAQLQKENEELKRIVDPLRAQVAQLQKENEELKKIVDPLKAQIAALEEELAKLRGYAFVGQSFNWDCDNLDIYPALASKTMAISEDKTESGRYVLDRANGLGWSAVEPRAGFSLGQTLYRGYHPGDFFLILVSREKRGLSRRNEAPPLQRPVGECRVLVTLSLALSAGYVQNVYTNYVTVTDYVTAVADVSLAKDAEAKARNPSPEALAWIQDQVAHAEKEDAPAIPTAASPNASAGGRPPDPRGEILRLKQRSPGPASLPQAPEPEPGQAPQGASEQEFKALKDAPTLEPNAAQQLRQGLRGSAQGLQDRSTKEAPPPPQPQPGGKN